MEKNCRNLAAIAIIVAYLLDLTLGSVLLFGDGHIALGALNVLVDVSIAPYILDMAMRIKQ